ncbi:LuxR C-terminal-related transcriptional regulator [Sciscionella sediminilitoris]|uniref:LuxR C-terminal-related transcriptional regulator n=1 Tax=Sciscionella sediminilitoris TaxID=1445613 RepID=UPI0004DF5CB6|nr:LuxR family transcriptional regulator [Sciscionella sp. SE31]
MPVSGREIPEPAGRIAKRAELRAFAEGDWPDTPLLITGEAGIGKTTLLDEAVAHARSLGRTVLRTSAAAPESGMAYGSLNDLLGEVVDEELLATLPELQRAAVEVVFLRSSAPAEPRQLAVVTGIAMLLRELAARGPLLLAIDDVHWMDAESVLALGYGLRRISEAPVALLGTGLVYPAPFGAHTTALPFSWARRVELHGLGPQEFGNLLRDNGIELDGADIERLRAETGGNPGWALEMREPGTLPRSITAKVRAWLGGLSEPARDVLATTAAFGRARVDQVRRALDGECQPQQAIDAASTELAIVERDGELQPSHPMLGSAALVELAPGARRQLHARLAGVVEEPVEQARHLQLSAEPGADERTADALMGVARRARARGEIGTAARIAERALAHVPAHLQTAVWLVETAAMQFSIGAFNRVCELLAAVEFTELPIGLLDRGLPLLIEATTLIRGNQITAEVIGELRAAMREDPLRLAVVDGIGADPDFFPGQSRTMAEHAVSVLDSTGLADTALYRALGELVEQRVRRGLEPDPEIAERHEQVRKGLLAAGYGEHATTVRTAYCLRIGLDPVRTRDAFRTRLATATERGEDYLAAQYRVQLAANELVLGDTERAAELLRELDTRPFGDGTPPVLLAAKGRLLITEGRIAALHGYLAEQAGSGHGDQHYRQVYTHTLTGMAANRELRWADATEALAAAARLVPWLGKLDPITELAIDTEFTEALIGAGRFAEAGKFAERVVLPGVRSRLHGMLRAAEGDLEAAEKLLTESVTELRDSPFRPAYARSLLELGRVRRRKRARRSARETLKRATGLLTEIGDVPLIRQGEAELARLASVRDSRELTAAERRVAELVVTGASNREVAAALFVSVRTVESHVQAVYRKLGVHSRTQLAVRLLPNAVPEPRAN